MCTLFQAVTSLWDKAQIYRMKSKVSSVTSVYYPDLFLIDFLWLHNNEKTNQALVALFLGAELSVKMSVNAFSVARWTKIY